MWWHQKDISKLIDLFRLSGQSNVNKQRYLWYVIMILPIQMCIRNSETGIRPLTLNAEWESAWQNISVFYEQQILTCKTWVGADGEIKVYVCL